MTVVQLKIWYHSISPTVDQGDPKEPELLAAHHIQLGATVTPAVITDVAAPEWEIADKSEDSGAAREMLT